MADNNVEDPFSEYLDNDGGQETAGYSAPAAPPADDATLQLRLLVESAQRQEQLMGKVCSLLVGLDEKLGQVSANQERLEGSLTRLAEEGAFSGKGGAAADGRGQIVAPPGKTGNNPGAGPGRSSISAAEKAEKERQEAEKIAAERARIEAENVRRAEELARKKVEAEKRAREQAEIERIAEEKRREEEARKKAVLEQKTSGLMSDLISSGGGGGLFGDDIGAGKKKKGGGLFDD